MRLWAEQLPPQVSLHLIAGTGQPDDWDAYIK